MKIKNIGCFLSFAIIALCSIGLAFSVNSYVEVGNFNTATSILNIDDFRPSNGSTTIQLVTAEALFTLTEQQNKQLKTLSLLGIITFSVVIILSLVLFRFYQKKYKS